MARKKIKKVVFVCTGNTCRSPMAEAAFTEEIKQKNLSAVVMSAGLRVSPYERDLSINAAKALKKAGLSLPYFSSTSLTKETLMTADIIICMTREQCEALKKLKKRFLEEEGKTRARNNVFDFEMITGKGIPDPYGKDEEAYEKTLESIVAAFPAIEEKWFIQKPRKNGDAKLKATKTSRKSKKTCVQVRRESKPQEKNEKKRSD